MTFPTIEEIEQSIGVSEAITEILKGAPDHMQAGILSGLLVALGTQYAEEHNHRRHQQCALAVEIAARMLDEQHGAVFHGDGPQPAGEQVPAGAAVH